MQPDAAVRQMQKSLDRGRGLCLLIGTGLTIAATGDPSNSWSELIKRGAAACEENGRRDRAWVERVAADVDTGEIGDILAAAEKVTYGLGGQESEQFYEWLTETVGSVQPKHLELLDQVKRLASHGRVTVVTTNYDSLMSDHLGIRPVTWRAAPPVLKDAYVDHRKQAVIHVHGHWPDLPSIVFGAASYASLRAHPSALEFLKQALLANTVVTMGVGAGLDRPYLPAAAGLGGRCAQGRSHDFLFPPGRRRGAAAPEHHSGPAIVARRACRAPQAAPGGAQ